MRNVRVTEVIISTKTTKSLQDLHRLITATVNLQPGTLIGIDGMDGSGKSFLAGQLAPVLGATHINLDDFLEERQGGFLNYLRYEEVLAAINLPLSTAPVIVEGDCLRAVLDRLCITADVHVYVKHLFHGIIWQAGEFLELADTPEVALAIEDEKVRSFAMLSSGKAETDEDYLGGLHREIVFYHFQYRPHERADIIYELS